MVPGGDVVRSALESLAGGLAVAGYLAIVVVLFDLWPAP
jgi:hypothetical protein